MSLPISNTEEGPYYQDLAGQKIAIVFRLVDYKHPKYICLVLDRGEYTIYEERELRLWSGPN